MTEYSFPVVDEPLSAEQWGSVTRGVGDGILDEGDGPYDVTNISNTNNTVDVTVGSNGFAHAILSGFYHKIDATVTLSIPAVAASTKYTVALQYDPLRAALPVKLDVFTGALDTSQGKRYLVIYTIQREPNQLLSDATRTPTRPRISSLSVYGSSDRLPPPSLVTWGSVALCHNNTGKPEFEIWFSFTTEWKRIYSQSGLFEWEIWGDNPSWSTPVAGGYKWAIGRRGQERRLRGRVALASGAAFSPGIAYDLPLLLGVLPVGDRPRVGQSLPATCALTGGKLPFARVEIKNDGDIAFWVSEPANWISLDGVGWEVD